MLLAVLENRSPDLIRRQKGTLFLNITGDIRGLSRQLILSVLQSHSLLATEDIPIEKGCVFCCRK